MVRKTNGKKNRLKKAVQKFLAGALVVAMMAGTVLQDAAVLTAKAAGITVTESAGYEEGAYVEWSPVEGADGYQVSVSKDNSIWTLLDDELIRDYGSYMRADALGLTEGTWYMQIEAATFNSLKEKIDTVAVEMVTVNVVSHDRSGYAWVGGTASGAYNEDGSLRSDAQVIYVTETTKDTVSMTVAGATTNPCVGIQNILYGYKKGKETRPLDIRIIGNITDPKVLEAGDMMVDSNATGITIEGVGEDAVANGWGIRVKNATNVEIRNLAFMNCDSGEGDNIGLQQGNDYVWVHHCDFFYGHAGSDSDQVKGDGMLDCKKSNHATFSYNHFWDSGKSSLLGLSEGTTDLYVTYHHNWFDHSDSRHPRIRFFTTHVYNNYYDGNAKYGIGAAKGGASVFAENNYFRNCKYPMMISMQGSDVWDESAQTNDYKNMPTFSEEEGSIIKAYGNVIEGGKRFIPYSATDDPDTAWDESVDFDAYVASARDEQVPNTVKSYKGAHTYNNFDTAADFYEYKVDVAEDVPEIVKAHAGRVNGGDFQWTFDNDVDDASYDVNDALKAAVVGYTSSLVSVGGIQRASAKVYYTVTFDPANGEAQSSVQVEANQTVAQPADPTTFPEGKVSFDGWYNGTTKWNFSNKVTADMTLTAKYLAEGETGGETGGDDQGGTGGTPIGTETVIHDFTKSGKSSAYFAITGNINSKTGSGNYNGVTYSGNGIKMESSTSITFTTETAAKVVMVLETGATSKIKLNNTKISAVNGVAEGTVGASTAGTTHTITKGDQTVIYAIVVIPDGSTGGGDQPSSYTITIDKADGSQATTLTVNAGDAITSTMLPTPTRENYSFTGWVDGSGNSIVLPFTPTGNMTIKATWQAVGGGENPGDPDALYNKSLLAKDVPAGTYTESFVKNGFTVHAGAGEEQSVVVDANSKKINNVSYAARLKTGGPGTKEYRSIEFTTESAATLSMACMAASSASTYQMGVATLDSEGNFVDYTGNVTVDGTTVECTDGNIAVTGTNPGRYISLELSEAGTYYIYAKDGGINFYGIYVTYANGLDPVFYTVTFNTMGGLSVDSQKVQAGEACVEPAETLRSGYTFEGWYADYDCTVLYDFSKAVTGNITLYAKWKEGEAEGEQFVLDMKDLPARDYKEKFTKNGFTFSASSSKGLSVDYSTVTVDEVTYTRRLKLNGTGSTSDRNISFTLTKKAPLVLVAASGSAGTARNLVVTNGTATYKLEGIDGAAKYTQELEAGTWYVYSESSGINIYYISAVSSDDGDGGDDGGDDGDDGGDQEDPENKDGLVLEFADPSAVYIYTGSAIQPEIVVTYNGKLQKAGVDYVVKYTNNVKAASANAKQRPTITVTGKGNLTGSVTGYFDILPRDLSEVMVGGIVIAKGAKAVPVLCYNNVRLTAKDYRCENPNQKFTEDGEVVVNGIGNFTGTLTIPVKVVAKNELKKFTVTLSKDNLVYNGEEQKPSKITVLDAKSKAELTENVDYEIVYTGNLTNAGVKKFTVVGIGNYTGNIAKTYTIKPMAAATGIITASDVSANSYTYTAAGATPGTDLVLTYADGVRKEVLKEGTDYKVTYANNKKLSTAKSSAQYIVTFLGNYKGSKAVKGTYQVVAAQLDNNTKGLKITAADKVYTGKAGTYVSKPYVSLDGVTIPATAYTVAYYADKELTQPINAKNKLTLAEADTSKMVYIKLTGKGNYAPANDSVYAVATYKVVKKSATLLDLSKARVTVLDEAGKKTTKLAYTGYQVKPAVRVEYKIGKNWVEVDASKYEVSYVNNLKRGVATIVISGNGTSEDGTGYVGTKTATFTIVPGNMKSLFKNLLAPIM